MTDPGPPSMARTATAKRRLRQVLRRAAEPDRWVGFAALGWDHRELLSAPWHAICAALLASGAAGLMVTAVRGLLRRRPAHRSIGGWTAALRLAHHHAAGRASHNTSICCTGEEPR